MSEIAQPETKTLWSLKSLSGKVTSQCLWTACKVITLGIFLLIIGAAMSTVGFYSYELSMTEKRRGNDTITMKGEFRNEMISLVYLGPVIMGIGGFIIVATCVMTFEARDTASKIVPVFFRRTRVHADNSSNPESPVESAKNEPKWECFLASHQVSSTTEDGESNDVKQASEASSARKALESQIFGPVKTCPGERRETIAVLQQRRKHSVLQKCPSEPGFNKSENECERLLHDARMRGDAPYTIVKNVMTFKFPTTYLEHRQVRFRPSTETTIEQTSPIDETHCSDTDVFSPDFLDDPNMASFEFLKTESSFANSVEVDLTVHAAASNSSSEPSFGSLEKEPPENPQDDVFDPQIDKCPNLETRRGTLVRQKALLSESENLDMKEDQ